MTPASTEANAPRADSQNQPEPSLEGKKKKKKKKTRDAWISFAGRIIAQLVGAAATIFLGLYVVGRRYLRPPHLARHHEHGARRR